jgi:hypothetical protein
MKFNRIITSIIFCLTIIGCASLKPATAIKNGEIKDYKYIYISQTKSLTSSTGASINGQYYSTSKSVNKRCNYRNTSEARIYINSRIKR